MRTLIVNYTGEKEYRQKVNGFPRVFMNLLRTNLKSKSPAGKSAVRPGGIFKNTFVQSRRNIICLINPDHAQSPINQAVNFVLKYAVLAPSSHNTQPWIFRVSNERVALFADRTRALPANDPDDREPAQKAAESPRPRGISAELCSGSAWLIFPHTTLRLTGLHKSFSSSRPRIAGWRSVPGGSCGQDGGTADAAARTKAVFGDFVTGSPSRAP